MNVLNESELLQANGGLVGALIKGVTKLAKPAFKKRIRGDQPGLSLPSLSSIMYF